MATVDDFLAFVNASPSPFHAVEETKRRLLAANFVECKERSTWTLNSSSSTSSNNNTCISPGGKYFFTRNKSSIVAFIVGGKHTPSSGFSIIAAHTDSPCLKLKPQSKKESVGYLQVGVQTYGGGLWHTWFDRDLSIAGRVIVETTDGTLRHQLVRLDKPILRIPTLAIHLDRSVAEAFKFNNETDLTPMLCSKSKSIANDPELSHHKALLDALANKLSLTDVNKIKDLELCLYDTQPSCTGGLFDEYIFSPRLDNLMMSYCGLMALLNASSSESVSKETNVRVMALFDNEEVGSQSAYGAESTLLESLFRRLGGGPAASGFDESLQRSFLISADMAHAVHPNQVSKHEDLHRPVMQGGLVIKRNANQRYATTGPTALVIRELAKKHRIPVQEFVVRNDSPCGSTIGPILSANLGIRTVDVGIPQLSMHSIREVAGVDDIEHAVNLFTHFYEEFTAVDKTICVD